MNILHKIKNLEVWQKNLLVLGIGCAFSSGSYTMIIPFLPIYLLTELNVPPSEVTFWTGVLFSAAFFFGAVMSPYWGARADKEGRKMMIMRSGVLLGIVYFASGMVRTQYELFICRAIHGAVMGFIPGCLALMSDCLPKEKTGWGLGIIQASIAGGTILGPLIGGFLADVFGMRTSFFLAGSNILLASLAVKFLVKEEFTPKAVKKKSNFLINISLAFHNKALFHMLILFFAVQACALIMQPLITVYVAQLMKIPPAQAVFAAGLVFSLAGLSTVLAAPYWGHRGQEQGYSKVLFITMIGAGLILSLQFFSSNIWMFGSVQFLYGLMLAGIAPAINANVVDNTHEGFRGRAFGLVTSFQQLGSMTGPLLGGVLGSFLTIKYVFVITAMILIVFGYSVKFAINQNLYHINEPKQNI